MRSLFAFGFLSLLLTGCTCSSAQVQAPAVKAPEAKAPAAPVVKNKVKLQLPPAIYAVPGIETNIYFDNVVCVINPDNYVFDVKCTKGRNDQKRWRYTPKAGEEGTYGLELTVLSNAGVEAVATTKIIVTPEETGKGKEFGILVLGDSLTAASVYPKRLCELLTSKGHPQVKFLGTSGRSGSKALHEGYGGWKWSTFLTKTAPTKVAPGGKTFPRHRASPFLFDGKFSLAQYLKKNHNGRVPDFITIQLGVNDVFGASDANQQEVINTILGNADKLIANLRKDAPNAIIGVGLVTPGASTQDAFGNNYACGQTRWQYKKNQHALNAAMLKKFAAYPDKKVFLIPTNVNLDCENNYPVRREAINGELVKGAKNFIIRQSNGVHPAGAGYNQMGDTYYCWIKYHLAR